MLINIGYMVIYIYVRAMIKKLVQVHLNDFFDYCGTVHHKFLPQGATINKECYLSLLPQLRVAIRRKGLDYMEGQFLQIGRM